MTDPESPNLSYHLIAEYAGFAREDFFEDHYATAQSIAGVLRISEPELTTSSIYNLVSSEMGPDAPEIEVLAVSALTATARSRVLRRPLARSQHELRLEREGFFHRLTPSSIKRQRALSGEQEHILVLEKACRDAEDVYVKEAGINE